MDITTRPPVDPPAGPLHQHTQQQQYQHSQHHRRPLSRSASVSSSSAGLQRAASLSLRDAPANPASHKSSTPPAAARRRSSAADGTAPFRDDAAHKNINRWSQSTASSSRSHTDKGHHHSRSFSRKLSLTTPGPLSASTGGVHGPSSNSIPPPPHSPPPHLDASPARTTTAARAHHHPASRSPASSPRRARPRSPAYDPPPSATTAPPKIPSLPPILLPSTVYDPNTPTSNSTANSPSAGPSTALSFCPSPSAPECAEGYPEYCRPALHLYCSRYVGGLYLSSSRGGLCFRLYDGLSNDPLKLKVGVLHSVAAAAQAPWMQTQRAVAR